MAMYCETRRVRGHGGNWLTTAQCSMDSNIELVVKLTSHEKLLSDRFSPGKESGETLSLGAHTWSFQRVTAWYVCCGWASTKRSFPACVYIFNLSLILLAWENPVYYYFLFGSFFVLFFCSFSKSERNSERLLCTSYALEGIPWRFDER